MSSFESDTFNYHGRMRQAAAVDFFLVSPADKLASLRADAAILTYDLVAPNYTIPSRCEPITSVASSSRACIDGTPACREICYEASTVYTSFCISSEGWPLSHIVAIEPIVSAASRPYLHHMVLHVTTATECEPNHPEESPIYAGPGPLGTGILVLPAEAGFRIGGASKFTGFRLEIHYDNPAFTPDVLDASGTRLYLSSELRMHDAAVLSNGDKSVHLANIPLPAGPSRWDFECPSAATALFPTPLTAFARVLHMHQSGARMITRQLDSTARIVKRESKYDYYDFAWQTLYVPDLVEWTIDQGDILQTSCYYDSPTSQNSGRKVFGFGSLDEMCIDFIFYYPALPSVLECGYQSKPPFTGALTGGSVPFIGQQTFDFLNRSFGLAKAPVQGEGGGGEGEYGGNEKCRNVVDWIHPDVGDCEKFDKAACELFGRDDFGQGDAAHACCACSSESQFRHTCADQTWPSISDARQIIDIFKYVVDEIELPQINCAIAIAVLSQFGIGCTDPLPIAAKAENLLPGDPETLAGVCPVSCGRCGGYKALPSPPPPTPLCPAGCVAAERRQLLFSALPCGPGCRPE
eukprot:6202306-Pleurochrysis_carterae.AAC.1